jgi:hypothetical protein
MDFSQGGTKLPMGLLNSLESDGAPSPTSRETLIFITKLITGLVAPIRKAVAVSLL